MIGTPEEFGKAVGDRLPFTLNSSHMAELVATMSPEEQEAFAVRIARIRNRLRLQDAGRAVRERSTKDNEVNLEVANPSTFAPPSTFLSFPLELIDRVLCNLDLRSLLKCKEVCKELKEHVERAKGIQSIMELEIYGQEMNPDNDWSATKVSQCLRQYQSTWEKPNWTDRDGDPITAPMENGGLWELSGGVLAQTDEDGHFHFRKFPSTTRHIQQETWDIIPDIPDICDFGMDPGQDLLVWITAPTPVLPTLSLHVRTLRMGDRHPLAREQVICYDHYLVRDYWSYSIKIMQDYIGLLAHYRPTLNVIDGVGRTEFMIWNWKEGKLELDLLTPRTQSFAFVPNRHVVLADLCDGPFGEDETEIYLTLIDFRAEGATKKSLGEVRNAIKLCYPTRAEDTVYSELDISSDPAPGWTPGKDDKSPFYVAKENRVFAVTIVAITREGRDAAFRHFIPLSVFRECLFQLDTSLGQELEWEEWAPTRTRILRTSVPAFNVWTCFTFGSRCIAGVFLRGEEDQGFTFAAYVYDFNQVTIRREQIEGGKPVDNCQTVLESSRLQSSIWAQVVETSLPYRRFIKQLFALPRPSSLSLMCTADHIVLVDAQKREYLIYAL